MTIIANVAATSPPRAGATGGVGQAITSTLPRAVVGLRQGSTGNDVKVLQTALIKAGIAVAGGADGVFGPATTAAVKTFQKAQKLQVTGTVDAATAAALGLPAAASTASSGNAADAYTALKVGSTGDAVIALQRALIRGGVYFVNGADGKFTGSTTKGIASYQHWNGLEVTGTPNAATVRHLGLTATSPASSTSSSGGATTSPYLGLKLGSRGTLVKELQRALIAAGIAVYGGADGAFGNATKSALVAFQKAHGITPSGVVDQATADKLQLGKASSSTGTAPSTSTGGSYIGLQVGSRGDLVKALQRALITSGLSLPGGADGVFGSMTRNTLSTFQRLNGQPQTGVVTAKDVSLLGLGGTTAAGAVLTFPQYGERSDRVRALQQSLIAAGIPVPGGADGDFGAATAGAIMNFQRREGLTVTGKVDAATANKLEVQATTAPTAPAPSSVTIKRFPVEAKCYYGDTWYAPRGGGRLHIGVDVIASKGKKLYAVVDGTISKVYVDGTGSLSGNGVRLQTADGTYFTYLHMNAIADGIKVGSKVKAGDVVGFVGMTGNAATYHLHFEVHPKGGSAVNPYPIVKAVDAC